jgi:hypothetical protein
VWDYGLQLKSYDCLLVDAPCPNFLRKRRLLACNSERGAEPIS